MQLVYFRDSAGSKPQLPFELQRQSKYSSHTHTQNAYVAFRISFESLNLTELEMC